MIGDPYRDGGKFSMRALKKNGYKDAGHDRPFKPAKDIHTHVKSDFPHLTDLNEVKKKYKDETGAVIIEPRNFLTSPIKRG